MLLDSNVLKSLSRQQPDVNNVNWGETRCRWQAVEQEALAKQRQKYRKHKKYKNIASAKPMVDFCSFYWVAELVNYIINFKAQIWAFLYVSSRCERQREAHKKLTFICMFAGKNVADA